MASTTKTARQSLQATAYEYIKKKISTCEYAPNQLLSESILQQELGMSRTPVREAITRLSQEGLLTVFPKRGILVSGIGLNDINMIYEVRQLVEPHILRNYGSRLDQEEIRKFEELYHAYRSNSKGMPVYDEDDRFHSVILAALPNVYLHDMYSRIQTQNIRLRILTGETLEPRVRSTIDEHLSIITACLKQDWDAAADAMSMHIQLSREAALTMILQSSGDTMSML